MYLYVYLYIFYIYACLYLSIYVYTGSILSVSVIPLIKICALHFLVLLKHTKTQIHKHTNTRAASHMHTNYFSAGYYIIWSSLNVTSLFITVLFEEHDQSNFSYRKEVTVRWWTRASQKNKLESKKKYIFIFINMLEMHNFKRCCEQSKLALLLLKLFFNEKKNK